MNNSSEKVTRSSFTINIIFVVLIIVGMAITPLLSLQLNPTRYLPSLTISYSWPEAPARVVEQEVTAVLEGVLATVPGVTKLTSSTTDESATISIGFDKKCDIRQKRFEVASLIREACTKLPEEVSYPSIAMNIPSNTEGSMILSFQITGNASPSYIYSLAEEKLKPQIALVKGVYEVNIYGSMPLIWELVYDHDKMASLNIKPDDIKKSIKNYLLQEEAGGGTEEYVDGEKRVVYVTLTGNNCDTISWGKIPVARRSGRIIMLTDIAKVKLKDQTPRSYYRVNGLNTITMTVSSGRNVNNVKVADEVRAKVEKMKGEIPAGFNIITSTDNTTFIKDEISKNVFRAILSVVLLLIFVLLISRELNYLLIITISLIANIFIAFIFYYFFKLEIHLYSLAGITVSFGIIINNTIVMTDHIRHKGDRKVGISLLAATLTTIGALVVIFFLDEATKVTLSDFAAVVIINLSVSFLIALFFIPSLAGAVKLRSKYNSPVIKRKRWVVKITGFYARVIDFIIRFRIVFIILAVLAFGIPLFYLPDSLPVNNDQYSEKRDPTGAEAFYNRTLGNRTFVTDVKPILNKVLGGSFRLFNDKLKNSNYYYNHGSDDVQRTQLDVRIGLSEDGLTIDDINDVCKGLENMVTLYSQVDKFVTRVYDASSASMTITFIPEEDFTAFPFMLKAKIEDYMNGIGSYHASVTGVGQGFSNQVSSDYIQGTYNIVMRGYNYDELKGYAEDLKARLIAGAKGRIKDVYLLGGDDRWWVKKDFRNYVNVDRNYIALAGSDVSYVYNNLRDYSRNTIQTGDVFVNGISAPVVIRSDLADSYDLWRIRHQPMTSSAGSIIKMGDFTSVHKEVSDNTISREDQQYVITVAYDFIGNSELGRIILKRNVEETASLLPLGYNAKSSSYIFSWDKAQKNYPLIFLVVLIIFFVCSVLLESLSQPLVVISLIPFSFIGLFVTFSVFELKPDEGAFAALVLLCGIVVNATLYVLDEYNHLRHSGKKLPPKVLYLKAFNSKIIPIILTKLSTIIGLVPFLLTGRNEQFWFTLAAGTIGGLMFSMIGLLVYQPLMLNRAFRKKLEIIKSE
jgi:multidrug efflux pump subunit AcrB